MERFKIKEQKPPFDNFLQVMFDDKEISIADLVRMANILEVTLTRLGYSVSLPNNKDM